MTRTIGTLHVEQHDGHTWLVLRASPVSEHVTLLARFVHADAADAYTQATAQAMAFAREVGRSGLG